MLAMNLDRTILCGAIGTLLRLNRPTLVATLYSYFKSPCNGGRDVSDRSRNRRSVGGQVLTSCETIHGTLTSSSCQHVRHFGKTAMETHKSVHHDNIAPCRHAAAHLGRSDQKYSLDDVELAGGDAADARDTRLKPAAAVPSQKDRSTPRPLRSMEVPVEHGANRRNRRTDLLDDSSPHDSQIVSQSLPHLVDHEMPSAPPLEVLYRDQHFAVVCKPPLLHVHRPEFGSGDKEFLLQKARDQLGQRVYPPHRLDRGTSGCLLLAFSPRASKILHEALAHRDSLKTYVAMARGSGKAFRGRGWFTENRPMKDEAGTLREASTNFLFVKGGVTPEPRCCLVLARPSTGRFHQIRRHLNGLNHPVMGDASHGDTRFNRDLVRNHAAPVGRLMLHCLRLRLPSLPPPWSRDWEEDERSRGVEGEALAWPEGREQQGRAGGGVCRSNFDDDDDDDNRKVWLKEEACTTRGPGGSFCESAAGAERCRSSKRTARGPSTSSLKTNHKDGACKNAASARVGEGRVRLDAPEGGESTSVASSGGRRAAGLDVSCPPPDDMMTFLRTMSWWEEGMLEAAERSRLPE